MKLYQRVFSALMLLVVSGLFSTATQAEPVSQIQHYVVAHHAQSDFNWHNGGDPTGGGN